MLKRAFDHLAHELARRITDRVLSSQEAARADAILEATLLAAAATALAANRARATIEALADVELGVFSQFGDDGIIDWLIHHNGDMPPSFVEFGVEDYRESNTRHLLMTRNWRGLVMDGSPDHVAAIRSAHYFWRHDLTAQNVFITRDNINTLMSSFGFDGDIGLLSIDIDGNDYWVWQAIEAASPHIVVAEYNAVFGDLRPLTVPYDPAFVRTRAHPSNLYFGASLPALVHLADAKGYTFAGTNRAGGNAYFIRNDRWPRFAHRLTTRAGMPSRFRESRGHDGELTYLAGRARSMRSAHARWLTL